MKALFRAIAFAVLCLIPMEALGEEADDSQRQTAQPAVISQERNGLQNPRVVVLEISFSETIEGPLRTRLSGTLISALRRQGFDVLEPEIVEETLRPLGRSLSESCRGGICVGWILDVLDADAGLVATVDALENSYSVSVTLLGAYGDELVRTDRRCDICTFDELAESVAVAGGQLANQVPRRVPSGRVGVFPYPPNAEISIDGTHLGRGTLSIPLPAGSHTIEGTLEGHLTARQIVDVSPDGTTRVELRLNPGDQQSDQGTFNFRPWFWSMVGTGLALAITGAVLVGVFAGCGDEPRDQRCNSGVSVGAGFLGTGIGTSLVAGITMLLFHLFTGDQTE